jgi:hypothetical protein
LNNRASLPHFRGNQTLSQTKLNNEIIARIIKRLKESNDSSEVIGNAFGISSWLVRAINRGESWPVEGMDYPIRQHLSTLKHETSINHCMRCGREIHRGSKYCVPCLGLLQRKSERPEPLELARMIKGIGFRNVGKQFGVSDNAVKKWCETYGIPRQLKDLINWCNEKAGIIDPPKPPKKKPEDYMKSVRQIDPTTNEVIKIFKSVSEAARAVGCANSPSRISKACKEGRKAAGHLWEFA